ncbi:DUF1937 family protein [Desulfovibrio mangrovi]|uniref:DUF1937 family protein n=1 Tax=Desulfovibrio mangrovi TaxID=2976983 RepID=UPI0022460CFE|nr:DUF1937 family protein [Desulfovibrio mangrovi]UZP67689.1 DUF1937 family protein [Desulfovibrio mangrovi]
MIPLTHVYLATPYTHTDARVREARFLAVTQKAAEMWKAGLGVYSPITLTHEAAVRHELPTDWRFWNALCRDTLSRMHELHVLCLPLWDHSTGVRAEIDLARSIGLPVIYHAPDILCTTCPDFIVGLPRDGRPCGHRDCIYDSPLPAAEYPAAATLAA